MEENLKMKAHVIYSPDHQISLENVDVLTKSCDRFNISYELIKNVTPPRAVTLMDKYSINKMNTNNPGMIKYMSRGPAKGCFMSHYLLWMRCVEANETFLVLEHDAGFVRPLPDNLVFTDAIHLNPNHDYTKQDGPEIAIAEPFTGLVNGQYFSGTEAYLIKPHAAQHAINVTHSKGWLPSDKHFNRDSFTIHQTTPNVAIVTRNVERNGQSLIDGPNKWKDIK